MPDKRIRALREELDRLIKTSHRLQEEIAEALGESVRHTGDKPSSATGHKPPRKSTTKKSV
jgi:hypothetical protein